jgi:Photosystem II 12 kDa extrinsic protein (PsbU)
MFLRLFFFLTTLCLSLVALSFVDTTTVTAFTPAVVPKKTTTDTATTTRLMANIDRRSFVSAVTAAAVLSTVAAPPDAAVALSSNPADNEIVKEQRTVTKKLDVNNAPVADYMKFPGLYPTIGGKIANNGPYDSVKDVYKVLTTAEQTKLKQYANELTATPATGLDPMRGRDPYRTSFNDFKEVKVDAI